VGHKDQPARKGPGSPPNVREINNIGRIEPLSSSEREIGTYVLA